MPGNVYFIQPTQLLGTKRYKVGMSNSLTLKRCSKGYLKGTRYLCIMEVNEPARTERLLKSEFGKTFHLVAGAEYFELKTGQTELDMIKLFFEIATKEHDKSDNLEVCGRLLPFPTPQEVVIDPPKNQIPSSFETHFKSAEYIGGRILRRAFR